jgi:hypothetical protein
VNSKGEPKEDEHHCIPLCARVEHCVCECVCECLYLYCTQCACEYHYECVHVGNYTIMISCV